MSKPLRVLLAVAVVAGLAPAARAQLAPDDRVRIAEAYRLAEFVGDRIWQGWSDAPFPILLVTQDREYLVRHPSPTRDFERLGYDSLLHSDVLARPRRFPPGFLATFPAVNGVPTIVVGTAAATGKGSTEWVLTLMHEHFHQLQTSRPEYFARVGALDLARGDSTGMWMLNFPFPYDSATVAIRAAALAAALDSAAILRARNGTSVEQAREQLRRSLRPDEERYLAFQLWQEGVARYTELAIARDAVARGYEPAAAFAALPDYHPYATVRDSAVALIARELRELKLPAARRVMFYPIGAATAMLLDERRPGWRAHYFDQLSLDALFR